MVENVFFQRMEPKLASGGSGVPTPSEYSSSLAGLKSRRLATSRAQHTPLAHWNFGVHLVFTHFARRKAGKITQPKELLEPVEPEYHARPNIRVIALEPIAPGWRAIGWHRAGMLFPFRSRKSKRNRRERRF